VTPDEDNDNINDTGMPASKAIFRAIYLGRLAARSCQGSRLHFRCASLAYVSFMRYDLRSKAGRRNCRPYQASRICDILEWLYVEMAATRIQIR
jgi:hypothetical protein